MVRTQIQLTAEQAENLRRLAAMRGVSISALVREAVEQITGGTDPEARRRRARAIVGKYASGEPKAAAEHDRHLAEAYLT